MHERRPYQGTNFSKEISSEPTIHIQGIQLHHVSFQGVRFVHIFYVTSSSCSNIFSFQTQGMSNRKTSVRTNSNPMNLNTVQRHPMKRCSMHIDKYNIKYFVFRSCLAGDWTKNHLKKRNMWCANPIWDFLNNKKNMNKTTYTIETCI